MSNTARLTRGLLALTAVGALLTAPVSAAVATPLAPPTCAGTAGAELAGPCTDRCRSNHRAAQARCDNTYTTCLRSGQNPRKCQEQRDACRANAEKKYRDCLVTCTRRTA